MSRKRKWIVAALVLLGLGVFICGFSFVASGFNFGNLSAAKYITETHTIENDFRDIKIDVNTEKVVFSLSDDETCRVVCFEDEKDTCDVRVDGQTLIIDKPDRHKWTWYIGIFTYSPEITVYLPETVYGELTMDTDTGDVIIPGDFSFDSITAASDTGDISCDATAKGNIRIETDTGHISVSGLSASGMELKSDTGDMKLSEISLSEELGITEQTGDVTMGNVSCRNFTSKGDTGGLTMENVVASGEFNLRRDTGDIIFDWSDAETIYVETDTGDVKGSLLTEKVFITETDTGGVDVPKTITGGRCEITTDTGDIRIEIKQGGL